MRFRRKIRIAKGVHINLSGSGASLSVGPRGASVTMGKRGTYLNAGIPGTGIYDRKRIGGGHKLDSTTATTSKQIPFQVKISLDEKGKPVIEVTNEAGEVIENDYINRKVKRGELYKTTVRELMDEKRKQMEETLQSFIAIYKSTPSLLSKKKIQKELAELQPKNYKKIAFPEPKPTEDDIRKVLRVEARKNVHKLLFWKNKRYRKRYVEEKLPKRLQLRVAQWESKKKAFEVDQNKISSEQNAIFKEKFSNTESLLTNYLSGEEEFVHHRIEQLLKEIVLPVEFSLDYDYHKGEKRLSVDLDLPEIEDMPREKVNTLVSGKISIKKKTQKEIKQDYAECVCGIAFYFAGLFFNITSEIKTILFSGYTQRIDRKTGHEEDQYIYSVKFDRAGFKKLNIQQIDPILGLTNFEHKMKVTKTFIMKTIEPF